MSDVMRIFYSKIEEFDRCRKQYWFHYRSGLDQPVWRDTPASLVGTGVHRALKVYIEANGDREVARRELETYTRMPFHASIAAPSEHYDNAFKFLETGLDASDSITAERTWGELSGGARWESRGFEITTRIDRVDLIEPGHWQLIDWKTGRSEFGETIDLQLDIAHVVLRQARQLAATDRVTSIGWNLRTGERRERPLDRDDAVATMKRIAGIANTIRTATEFEATPSVACSFCSWRDRCPEAAQAVITDDDVWTADETPEPNTFEPDPEI